MNSKFSLASIFSDNMVLQRNVKIPIWGTAEPGEEISVDFAGQNRSAVTGKDSKWLTHLDPMPASCEPRKMIISSSAPNPTISQSQYQQITNILVGEVWIAGGQSNMQFALADSMDAKKVVSKADHLEIRCYQVPRIPYVGADLENPAAYFAKPEWKVCTPKNAGAYPAVAYHFAVKIKKALKVPVGIVSCSWGGTSASSWMSEKYLSSDKDIKIYLDEYQALVSNLDMEKYEKDRSAYDSAVDKFVKMKEKAVKENISGAELDKLLGPYPWPPPAGPKNFQTPSGLYHTMVEKIAPYAVKGVIFYQGESDVEKASLYEKLFAKMIQNWRDDWKNPDLPFLFTQITTYGCDGKPDNEDWAVLREQQLFATKKIYNAYMAVSIDVGDMTDIHPENKRPIGERLALIARCKVYGQKIVCSGPVFHEMQINGDKAILSFNHIGKGLVSKGKSLKGFKICGPDKVFVDAKAEIKKDTIEVSSSQIKVPRAVRYGWANYAEINLFNKNGLPASPFRTE
ncbi:MAG TPA: hypothetical protein DCZ94_02180 [Lentisphaeria bacterium]|nr:MAG: hypothetical protein A2X48_19910 [Lentisphaerae bacterium GWF2_49_21]HBC85742.1 hypothetical protein [Lentisphaeria bacterium]